MTLSVILCTVYLFGFFFLLIALAMEDLQRNKLRADSLIAGSIVLFLWPVIVAMFLLLTGFYIATWVCVPTIRRSVRLKDGIRDFWS